MEKKALLTSILKKLEKIEENLQGQLQGGFASISITHSLTDSGGNNNQRCPTNNCLGGNCVEGCGGNHTYGCGHP